MSPPCFFLSAMAVFSSYYWSGFPFDNLCKNENEQVSANYVGNHTVPVFAEQTIVDLLNGTVPTRVASYEHVAILPGDPTYRYCLQDYMRSRGRQTFPFVAQFQPEGEEWMEDEQETVTTIYGWTAFGFFLAYIAMVLFMFVYSFYSYFNGSYTVSLCCTICFWLIVQGWPSNNHCADEAHIFLTNASLGYTSNSLRVTTKGKTSAN